MIKKHPPQLPDLHKKIKEALEVGRYVDTTHAKERQNERKITLSDALYVLKTGRHEKNKTVFDTTWNKWKYAIRGETPDKEDVRVIITFDDNLMVIITVMYVFPLKGHY
ncbi:MAG: DUF4258 domain-containing protein [Verrucomicrobia bacterium]|nr:DUF4258 domain-containing protein [Verrucomicrobiota bacterium]MBS0646522.1 DUF4258 domain-containing protein [Verrucomicrobiota bacterium]